jgi:alanine dehydrogenase
VVVQANAGAGSGIEDQHDARSGAERFVCGHGL